MIREGQAVNERTQNMGNTPLHIAARNGHYLIVKYLLEIGAATSQQNMKGLTPKQFLQESLVTDPAKIEVLANKQKTKAGANQVRNQQKQMGDTYKLLIDHEK